MKKFKIQLSQLILKNKIKILKRLENFKNFSERNFK